MSWLAIIAIAYAVVFIAIQVVMRIALRSEPTAHGQIVGRQAAFWLGLVWPPVLAWIFIVLIAVGVRWLWRKAPELRA